MKLSEIKEKYITLLKGIKICKDKDFVEPVFILMYATIDSLAWLNSLEEDIRNRKVRDEFIDFVDKYILKKINSEVTAEELYNARCSIIHTISARSKGNLKHNIRYLVYANNEQAKNEGSRFIEDLNQNAICIDVINMLEALVNAIVEFFKDIKKDKYKEKIIINKAEEYYSIFYID